MAGPDKVLARGRGQRWRRPRRARANYKSRQPPLRPSSAGPSRSPGAPGGAAGPRAAGGPGGGFLRAPGAPAGAAGRAGERGAGECPRERAGRAGAAMRGRARGPCRGARPGATSSVLPLHRRPERPPARGEQSLGRDGEGAARPAGLAPVPPLRPQGRAQPKLGAVNRQSGV